MTSVSAFPDVEVRSLALGDDPGLGPVELDLDELRRGLLLLGRAGSGKTTLLSHLASGLIEGLGQDVPGSLLVLDPSGDLVDSLLRRLRVSDASRVRHLDYSGSGRMPLINLLDPDLFPDEARCVENLVAPLKHAWSPWNFRVEDLLRRGLSALYQYNSDPEIGMTGRLGFLDLVPLLDEGLIVGNGPDARCEMTSFQRQVVERASPVVREWFGVYFGWNRGLRAEALSPLRSRLTAYAASSSAGSRVSLSQAALGQRVSTVSVDDLSGPGLAVLASVPASVLGSQPAAILGSALSGLPLHPGHRWVVADDVARLPGFRWPWMVDNSGETPLMSARGLRDLCHPGAEPGQVRAVHVSRFGTLAAFGVSAEDSAELAAEFSLPPGALLTQGPWHCHVRVVSGSRGYRAAGFVARDGAPGVSAARTVRVWADSVGVPVADAFTRVSNLDPALEVAQG